MLEMLNTVAAIGTFVVIAATAIAAVFQLRHLRAANQLEGLLTVLARVEDSNFNSWLTDTQQQLPHLLSDPDYVRSVINNSFDRSVAWLQLGNSYDWVGNLVKNKLIPEPAFLDVYSFRVVQAWELMIPVTLLARFNTTDGIWENFEFLYMRALAWADSHPNGAYPKHMARCTLPPIETALPAVAHVLRENSAPKQAS